MPVLGTTKIYRTTHNRCMFTSGCRKTTVPLTRWCFRASSFEAAVHPPVPLHRLARMAGSSSLIYAPGHLDRSFQMPLHLAEGVSPPSFASIGIPSLSGSTTALTAAVTSLSVRFVCLCSRGCSDGAASASSFVGAGVPPKYNCDSRRSWASVPAGSGKEAVLLLLLLLLLLRRRRPWRPRRRVWPPYPTREVEGLLHSSAHCPPALPPPPPKVEQSCSRCCPWSTASVLDSTAPSARSQRCDCREAGLQRDRLRCNLYHSRRYLPCIRYLQRKRTWTTPEPVLNRR